MQTELEDESPARRAGGEPMFFGPDGALFGWFYPGAPARTRDVGIVLVPPIGHEIMSSFDAYRELAERLSRAGFAVVRFDLHGTGDSGGTDADPGRVARWSADVAAACDEVRARAGVRQVGLVGLRLGATLALEAAAHRDDVASLVSWCPCRSGKTFVRETRALRMMEARYEVAGGEGPQLDAKGGDEEVVGFLLTGETLADLGALDPTTHGRAPARVLLISRADLPPEQQVATRLRKAGANVDAVSLPGFAEMMVAPHHARTPEVMLAHIVAWLSEQHPAGIAAPSPASPEARSSTRLPIGARAVTERTLRFGDAGALFGVLTRPAEPPAAQAARTAVVFLNTAAHNRTGAHRVYVPMARAWAAEGIPVLRFDLRGIGDSPSANGRALYSRHAVGDVSEALAVVRRETGAQRVVLIGLCAGAYVGYHAALAGVAADELVLINPQTLDFREGDSLDVKPSTRVAARPATSRIELVREGIRRALAGELDVPKLAARVAMRAKHVAKARARAAVSRVAPRLVESAAAREISAILSRGVTVRFLFAGGDPGLDYLEEHVPEVHGRFAKGPRFHLEIIEGPDHTFTELAAQAELHARLTRYLRG
jgi:alpha-beta hydrolase superfamily lysophospholipase